MLQLLEVFSLSTAHGSDPGPLLMPHVAGLVNAYAASEVATAIRAEIRSVAQPAQGPEGSEELPDVMVESELLRGRKRATWATQFRILSGRAFKNMYGLASHAEHALGRMGQAVWNQLRRASDSQLSACARARLLSVRTTFRFE